MSGRQTHRQTDRQTDTHTYTHTHAHTHTLYSKDQVRPVVRTPRLRLSSARGTKVTQLGTVMTPRRRSPRSLAMTPRTRSARFTGDSLPEIFPNPWSLVYFLFYFLILMFLVFVLFVFSISIFIFLFLVSFSVCNDCVCFRDEGRY